MNIQAATNQASAAESLVERLRAVDLLLGGLPRLRDIRRCRQLGGSEELSLRVDRSMPFEPIAAQLDAFLALSDRRAEITYSSYDPALSESAEWGGEADVRVLWCDWSILRGNREPAQAAAWIADRAQSIRGAGPREPIILINDWPLDLGVEESLASWTVELNAALRTQIDRIPDVHLIPLGELSETQDDFFDRRIEQAGGYPFSARATTRIARRIGAVLIPGVLDPRLKALVLDLDDSLYAGVLGEDGPQGLRLTPGHRALQEYLVQLSESGLLLTLCSRNQHEDAVRLFAERSDFPLRWENFTAVRVSWQPKAEAITEIADELGIHPSAMLFLDDNPSELARAKAAHPSLAIVQAAVDAARSEAMLRSYPGITALSGDSSASLRSRDIRANARRRALQEEHLDKRAYLRSLQMKVGLWDNCSDHIARAHELSGKTNQFNVALGRLSRGGVQRAFGEGWQATTVTLSDALSDSGIVGVFLCEVDGDSAELSETLFSCRALGRDVETLALRHVLLRLQAAGVRELSARQMEGPRNGPALEWVRGFGLEPGILAPLHDVLRRVTERCVDHPATVETHR